MVDLYFFWLFFRQTTQHCAELATLSRSAASEKRIFPSKFQQIYNYFHFRGMSFISKTCQIVAGTNMIRQFHELFKFVFGGFLQFGPALRRTCHAIEVSSLRKTRAVLAASAAAALQLHFVHFLSFSGFALCRAPLPPLPPHKELNLPKRFTNLILGSKSLILS